MIDKERIVKNFIQYVKIPSPSKNEKKFADFIKGELEELDIEVYIDKSSKETGSNTGNIIAKLPGSDKKPPILFSCHLDTVTPSEGIKPIIKDGVIYSDGTTILGADNKAGIAAMIEALRVLKEKDIDHGPIEVVFSTCEEIGLLGVKHLEYERLESKMAFVLDSDGKPGTVIIQGPGHDNLKAKIIGKAAHAGVAPEEGISAIQIGAEAINKMKLLRLDEETTANIGFIRGGEATNIVAPELELLGEARSLDEEKLNKQSKHMRETIEEVAREFGGEAKVDISREYHSFKIDEDAQIVKIAREAITKLKLDFSAKSSGGGSDTSILNQKGIEAVNLAIGENKPHTLDENIAIKDLVDAGKLVLEIIKTV